MTKEKFLLEYLGGTKGDFLANVLVFDKLELLFKENNRSNSKLKTLKYLSNEEGYTGKYPTVEEFESIIAALPQESITSHQLFFLTKDQNYFDILHKYDYNLYKICFEENHYKTVQIESIFKNARYQNVSGGRKETIERYKNQHCEDAFDYLIDFEIFRKDLKINNTNRSTFLENKLKSVLGDNEYNFSDHLNFYKFNSEKQKENKKLLNYSDLYIDLNLSKYKLFESIEKNRYQKQLSKTWLPNEIVLFNETWKPKDYGYMNF